MAFINQEKKKELTPKIKEVLKKYNMKGTISINNYSTLCVNLKEGPLDFGVNYTKLTDTILREKDESDVIKFYTELVEAMKGNDWFDKSDIMTDYFHTAYYININVGKWDNHYKCISK